MKVKNMKKKLIVFAVVILLLSISFFTVQIINENNFEVKREKLLSSLYSNIKEAERLGKYRCCIEPPCTMCYLGDWVWEDGTCDCDAMIKSGEWGKVCPKCIRGIKEGRCSSEKLNTTCPDIIN